MVVLHESDAIPDSGRRCSAAGAVTAARQPEGMTGFSAREQAAPQVSIPVTWAT